MHSQGEVLQLLLKGNLSKENEKVSLLQQLHSTCVESISQKLKKDDNQEAETEILSETLEISKVGSIFDSPRIKPVLVLEWSFQECLVVNVKTIHFFCFGNCPGYAEKEVELNNNGKWCVYIDGIKREVDFEWTECPQDIKTFGYIPNLLNCLAKLSVCQGCDYQKYETALPPESEYGQPVFMTKDGTPATFVERLLSKGKQKVIRSTKCLIFLLQHEEVLEVSNCCDLCKSVGHHLRTLKSRKTITDKGEISKKKKIGIYDQGRTCQFSKKISKRTEIPTNKGQETRRT